MLLSKGQFVAFNVIFRYLDRASCSRGTSLQASENPKSLRKKSVHCNGLHRARFGLDGETFRRTLCRTPRRDKQLMPIVEHSQALSLVSFLPRRTAVSFRTGAPFKRQLPSKMPSLSNGSSLLKCRPFQTAAIPKQSNPVKQRRASRRAGSRCCEGLLILRKLIGKDCSC